MKKTYFLSALFLSACNHTPTPSDTSSPSTYSVVIDAVDPSVAAVTLKLEPNRALPVNLISRAEKLGAISQVENVRCNNQKIERNADSVWPVPIDCSTVNWNIRFDSANISSVRPSEQRSLYMRSGWWVLSAPTSILRMQSESGKELTMDVSIPNQSMVKTLRSINAPPNYYVLGAAPVKTVSRGDSNLSYVSDDLQSVFAVIRPEKHNEAIAYFKSVIGPEKSRKTSKLSVIWFGAPRERREASGAAGYDTILANYIVAEDAPKREEQLLSLMLVFHEQFHQLDAGSHPEWVGESLANYYALKALKRAFPNDTATDSVLKRFIDPNRPVTIGLLDIQSEISKDNNRQNYGLLYTQGATFWSEVDMAIRQSSSNDESLDDLIPSIMELDIKSDDSSFEEIEKILSLISDEKLKALKGKYLS